MASVLNCFPPVSHNSIGERNKYLLWVDEHKNYVHLESKYVKILLQFNYENLLLVPCSLFLFGDSWVIESVVEEIWKDKRKIIYFTKPYYRNVLPA